MLDLYRAVQGRYGQIRADVNRGWHLVWTKTISTYDSHTTVQIYLALPSYNLCKVPPHTHASLFICRTYILQTGVANSP